MATYGQPLTRRVHALQLEINASLLMTTSRENFVAQVCHAGESPGRRTKASLRPVFSEVDIDPEEIRPAL